MNNIDILKKKIIYRSSHRGVKEMDILLGSFVKKYLNIFSKMELELLEQLLEIDDNELLMWYSKKKSKTIIPKNIVTNLLLEFKIE